VHGESFPGRARHLSYFLGNGMPFHQNQQCDAVRGDAGAVGNVPRMHGRFPYFRLRRDGRDPEREVAGPPFFCERDNAA
jgi:hypothetical protein